MFKIAAKLGKNRGFQKIPLRFVLTIPFVVQLFSIVGLVGYLSFRNGQQAIDDLAGQLTHEVSDRIEQNLRNYLKIPYQINSQNRNALQLKHLNLQNLDAWEGYLVRQAEIYHPDIVYIGVGNDRGEYRSGEKLNTGELRVNVASDRVGFQSYTATPAGDRLALQSTVSSFRLRQRREYQSIVQARKPIWTPVFTSMLEPTLIIGGGEAVQDQTQAGILIVGLRLERIGRFLHDLRIGKTGQAFIMERNGMLLATSTAELPFREQRGIRRSFPASASSNSLTQATATYLRQSPQMLSQLNTSRQLKLTLQDEPYYLEIKPLQDGPGLDWLIITIIPEADFTEQIYHNTYNTIGLCSAAILIFVSMGIIMARRITRPILGLNAAARDLAQGNFDRQVPACRIAEVGELGQSFNQMIQQLQQLFAEQTALNQALATSEYQLSQILEALPLGVLVVDAAGKCTYLNQTAQTFFGGGIDPNIDFDTVAAVYHIYQAGTDHLYPRDELPLLLALQHKSIQVDDLELRRGDETLYLEVRSTPVLTEQGEILYAVSTFQDISQRKQAERFLADYNATLEQQVQERTLALQQEIAEREKAEVALKVANMELEQLARVDGLTRLANRRHFDEYLQLEWQRSLRLQTPLSLILCDADYFKLYNDEYGHQAGDKCLQEIGRAMLQSVQRSTDLVARYGGEEFAVILPNTDSSGLLKVAQTIQAKVRELQIPHQKSMVSEFVTLSLGLVHTTPNSGHSPKTLVATADVALYRAKNLGRDRYWLQEL